jgi:hypothetical protein
MKVVIATPPPTPRAACDHGAPAVLQLQSTHRTSAGAVAYARCPCGAWLVLLDGQLLAAAHPGPRAATPPVLGERLRGRGRRQLWLWLWLWDHGQALRKWTWHQRRRERVGCINQKCYSQPWTLIGQITRGRLVARTAPGLTSGSDRVLARPQPAGTLTTPNRARLPQLAAA